MDQKYKIGDYVMLITGNQRMTITADRFGDRQDGKPCFDGRYRCSWQIGHVYYSRIFYQDALVLVASEKSNVIHSSE